MPYDLAARWVAFLALWFIVRRGRLLLIRPLSLPLFAIVTCVGPWSWFSVSVADHRARVGELLKEEGIFSDGVIREPLASFPRGNAGEISGVLRCLAQMHGLESMRAWSRPIR